MPARFHALRDDRIRAGLLSRERFVERAGLIQHARDGRLRSRDQIGTHFPETHGRDMRVQARIQFGVEQGGIGAGRYQIHAERTIRHRAHDRDSRFDIVRRFAHHPEQPEAARGRYRPASSACAGLPMPAETIG